MTTAKRNVLSGMGIGTLALSYLKPRDEPWTDRLGALACLWCFVGLLFGLWWLKEWVRRRHNAAALTDPARSEHQAEMERKSLRVATSWRVNQSPERDSTRPMVPNLRSTGVEYSLL